MYKQVNNEIVQMTEAEIEERNRHIEEEKAIPKEPTETERLEAVEAAVLALMGGVGGV